ncbi:retrovirus-related Pol polyprotein from transposon 297 [Trichonephila clavipes]|nr:retrovirus-related Pol polyprotein from transposon 297 [Trichonephila clavipes]
MPIGLLGAAPNFQKAIDIILKPVLGRFVNCYMNDVIIPSPSFNEHLYHLNQVFTLLRDAGLTLNKDKRHFAHDKLKYLGVIISKDGIQTDNNKVKVITDHAALTKLANGKNLSGRMIRWAHTLKLSEFNIEWEHRPGVQNVVANVLSRNPVNNVDGSQISSAALRALTWYSREQLIREQREDPKLGHI